MSVLIRI